MKAFTDECPCGEHFTKTEPEVGLWENSFDKNWRNGFAYK